MNSQFESILRLLDSGEYIRTMEYLAPAAQRHPDDPDIQLAYARSLYLAWRYDEAELILKSLLSSDSKLDAGLLLINLYLDVLKFEPAYEIAHRLHGQFPDNLLIMKLLADCLWRQRKYDESTEVLRKAVHLRVSGSNEQYLIGNMHLRLKNIGQAIDAFIESLRSEPDFQPASDALKHTLSSPENRLAALSHLKMHAEHSLDYRFWYGKALRYAHHVEPAMEELRSVFESQPVYQSITLEYAGILEEAGRILEAISVLEKNPDQEDDLHQALLGRLYLRQGEIEKACERFFTSIWIGDGIECYGELKVLANDDTHYPRLMEYAQRRYAGEDSPRSIGLIAQIHRFRCRFEEALVFLGKLLTLDPNHRWRSQYSTVQHLLSLKRLRKNLLPLLIPMNPSGIRNMMKSANRLRFFFDKLELLGTLSRKVALKGPSRVEIKLGNPCNNDCIGCCYRSPLLIEERRSEEWYAETIHPLIARQTIRQLIDEGVREIRFSGGGEPFMYPGFMDIVKEVLSHGIKVIIITNGTLLSKEIIETLFYSRSNVTLVVSLWAASPETYVKLHPNKTHQDFDRILTLLDHYLKLKRQHPDNTMHLVHTHVMNNINFAETLQMLQLGARHGVASIHYTMMLPRYYQTDQLLCNVEEISVLRNHLEQVIPRAHELGIHLFNIQQLMEQLSRESSVAGQFDAVTGSEVPCTIGWSFAMINADSEVHPCVESQRLNLGNLRKDSFIEIWNSARYRQFREKISTTPEFRKEPFFSLIECWKKCDHHDDENMSAYCYAKTQNRGFRKLRSDIILGLLKKSELTRLKMEEPPVRNPKLNGSDL